MCGITGIYSASEINIPEKLFYSLFALQHRGQESAGISYRKKDHLVVYKDLGLVSQVLGRYLNLSRESKVGIGHVRYSTHGGNRIENAHPVHAVCNKGDIALVHNGNLTNTQTLKKILFDEGSIFQSSSDTELILHLLSRSRKPNFEQALVETLNMMEGSFSLIIIHNDRLVAARDPQGFRPLYVGKKNGMTVCASETCAMDMMEISEYRSVEPGEIIYIDDSGESSEFYAKGQKRSNCVFELIYFARPDSQVFDQNVQFMRQRMGAALADEDRKSGFVPDLVVPVPDSGNCAAIGYSKESGIPFDFGLQRSHYAGRSFIMPTTSQREFAVKIKLSPVRSVIQGKRIVLIDDSLVRGTTSKILVRLLKEAGAKEVHLRLSAPEIKWPCYFGIDIPTREELISNQKAPEQIAAFIGADSVKFLPLKNLKECVHVPGTGSDNGNYCYGCFSGTYPIHVSDQEEPGRLGLSKVLTPPGNLHG